VADGLERKAIMRIFSSAVAAGAATIVLGAHVTAVSSQHHTDADRRGAQVMGFDQQLTVHRFSLYTDGGAIDVQVKDPADKTNLDAIRTHLPHIALLFGQGNFDAPMLVHDRKVPGTAEMARLKDRLTYKYVDTQRGGRVDIVTTDAEALAAVHQFLRFQIADHRTGDSTDARKR
jgi:hypothetical protein